MCIFFFQAEDGIRDKLVTGVQTCALPILPGVPRDLEKVILRCLQKEPDRRFQHMADVKVEIQEIKEESDSQPAAAQAPARRRRRWWLAAALAGALLLAVAVWLRWRPRGIELAPPRLVPLTSMR